MTTFGPTARPDHQTRPRSDLTNARVTHTLQPVPEIWRRERMAQINQQLLSTAISANDYSAGWLHRQPAVKEESITDWVLDFFQQLSPAVRYYQFNRYEEARFSGADWDWWFVLQNGCFALRVQAKKTRKGKNHYLDLTRKNQTDYQIELLLDSSADLNLYPIYVIYGDNEGIQRLPSEIKFGLSPVVISVGSAQEIYNLAFSPSQRIESSDIFALSVPLPVLFMLLNPQEILSFFPVPPRGPTGGPNPGGSDDGRHRGLFDSIPPIIRKLVDLPRDHARLELDAILREYQSIYSGSKGVEIVDTRIKG